MAYMETKTLYEEMTQFFENTITPLCLKFRLVELIQFETTFKKFTDALSGLIFQQNLDESIIYSSYQLLHKIIKNP